MEEINTTISNIYLQAMDENLIAVKKNVWSEEKPQN